MSSQGELSTDATANAGGNSATPPSKKQFGSKPTDTCSVCSKTVYPVEKIVLKNKTIHKACLRCSYCNKQLELATFASLDDKYYCKPHFTQLYQVNGDYSTGFIKAQNQRNSALLSRSPSVINNTAAIINQIQTLPENPPAALALMSVALKSDVERPPVPETVKKLSQTFEENNIKSKNEEMGVLNKEDYDDDGKVRRKSVLQIDSSETSRMIRIESMEKMKGVVNQIEKAKHSIDPPPKEASVEDLKKASENNQPDAGLTRSKTVRTYGQKPTDVCTVCEKLVYPTEKLVIEKKILHANCLRCKDCNKVLSLNNYNLWNGEYFCKPHAMKRIRENPAPIIETKRASTSELNKYSDDTSKKESNVSITQDAKSLSTEASKSGKNPSDDNKIKPTESISKAETKAALKTVPDVNDNVSSEASIKSDSSRSRTDSEAKHSVNSNASKVTPSDEKKVPSESKMTKESTPLNRETITSNIKVSPTREPDASGKTPPSISDKDTVSDVEYSKPKAKSPQVEKIQQNDIEPKSNYEPNKKLKDVERPSPTDSQNSIEKSHNAGKASNNIETKAAEAVKENPVKSPRSDLLPKAAEKEYPSATSPKKEKTEEGTSKAQTIQKTSEVSKSDQKPSEDFQPILYKKKMVVSSPTDFDRAQTESMDAVEAKQEIKKSTSMAEISTDKHTLNPLLNPLEI